MDCEQNIYNLTVTVVSYLHNTYKMDLSLLKYWGQDRSIMQGVLGQWTIWLFGLSFSLFFSYAAKTL